MFDPTAARMSSFSATILSNSLGLNLVKSLFLEMWDLLVARELDLGSIQGLHHKSLIHQLGVDVNDLGSVNPSHCAPGLSQHTCLEASLGQH